MDSQDGPFDKGRPAEFFFSHSLSRVQNNWVGPGVFEVRLS